jgi:ABC-type transport system involved in multi-copper enzyme maturation permease subunit
MKAWAIAKATVGEALRRRSLLATLAISVLVIVAIGLFTRYVGGREMTIAKYAQIAASLRVISFFGALLTLFISMSVITSELEKRTVYALLSKPLERYQFVVGKFLGCLIMLGMNLLVMAVVAFGMLVSHSPELSRGLAQSLGILFISLISLCALTVAFTTFMPSVPAGLIALGLYQIGKVPGLFRQVAEAEGLNTILRAVAQAVYAAIPYVTPRVNRLNFEAPVLEVGGQAGAVASVLLYSAVCIAIAVAVFSRKEL